MKSPIACLAASVLLGLAAEARAGLIDFTVAPGSQVNQAANGVGTSLALTTGVNGLADGSYSIAGADLSILSLTTLSITGIPTQATALGTYGNGTEVGDGSGGYILQADVSITPFAGYAAYNQGTLTLDVTSAGVVETGDLVSPRRPSPSRPAW